MSGRNPPKEEKNNRDMLYYFRKCTINKEGLVVFLKTMPLSPKPVQLLVIPRPFAFTFAKAFHVQQNHPAPSQMHKQWTKQYFMLDEKKIIMDVYKSCTTPCQASKLLPKELHQYSTDTKPVKIGQFLNADVMEECGQKILVVRDNLTSYTDTFILKNQTKPVLRDALIVITSRLMLGNRTTIRVDGHSSLNGLRTDKSLEPLGIFLEIGRPKNPNKNAVADKAIRELREQITKLAPHGGPISDAMLARATSHLNSLVRYSGRSAGEVWLSRDQITGDNILVNDLELSDTQFNARQGSHLSSARYSSRNGPSLSLPKFQTGDMVFVKTDRFKSKVRDSYYIIKTNENDQLYNNSKVPYVKIPSPPYHCCLSKPISLQSWRRLTPINAT